ncbi:MAG: SDR family NAD(P)-dependent oxidoreductase [Myxococcales bacterium]|nr:SDR family NAD(P)-dependent oxidoreductase [Myxococcales bacterium]
MPRPVDLATRYGPWAIVAGASEGLGAAFGEALARRGLNLVLLARRGPELESVAEVLRRDHGVQVRPVVLDLGQPGLEAELRRATALLDVGVAVYNAALAPVGALVEQDPARLRAVVDVNVHGPLTFARALAPGMVARKRGALVLMSSLVGLRGTPRLAAYAASKAFGLRLAEGMWAELRPHGIDVVASCAGAIRTPGYARTVQREAPGMLDPAQVAERTLAALGRGPRAVPGLVNRVAGVLLERLLPSRLAIRVMAGNTKDLT